MQGGGGLIYHRIKCAYSVFGHQDSPDPGHRDGDRLYINMRRGVFLLVFFQAGVGPSRADRLGHHSLSPEGLRRRNSLVYDLVCCEARVPLVVTKGGGRSPISFINEIEVFSPRLSKLPTLRFASIAVAIFFLCPDQKAHHRCEALMMRYEIEMSLPSLRLGRFALMI